MLEYVLLFAVATILIAMLRALLVLVIAISAGCWRLRRSLGVHRPPIKSMQTWVSFHLPSYYAFLKSRLDQSVFSGLPLTLFSVAALHIVVLFGGLTQEVVEASGWLSLDQAINASFAAWRSSTLVAAFLGSQREWSGVRGSCGGSTEVGTRRDTSTRQDFHNLLLRSKSSFHEPTRPRPQRIPSG